MSINYLLTLHTALAIFFDLFPEPVRLIISATLFLGYGYICLKAALLKWPPSNLMVGSIAILALLYLLSFGLHDPHSPWPSPSLDSGLRSLLPLLSGVAILYNRATLSLLLVRCLAAAFILYALLIAIAQPNIVFAGTLRLAPFAGGPHTSAYTVAISLIIIWISEKKSMINARDLTLAAASIYLLEGYGVRTAQVLLLAYIGMFFAIKWGRQNYKLFLQICLAGGLLFFSAAIFYFSTLDASLLNQFSSGRLSNYSERFDLFFERNMWHLLFGTGPGTDLLITEVWYWDAKDSHSDLLKALWNTGIIGLMATLVFLWASAKIDYRAALPGICAILASSAISNALLTRPNAAFLMFCVIAIALNQSKSIARHPEAQRRWNLVRERQGDPWSAPPFLPDRRHRR